MDRRGGWLLLAGVLVLAGLLSTGATAQAVPEDPDADVIGWENGYWHNESIQVDQSDGLSEVEQEAYVSRTTARVEVLRDREFNETVPVTVVPRSEYANRTTGNTSEAARAWNNQVWEALFVVGEDQDVEEVLHSTSTAQTTGAYFFATDDIRIITDTPAQPSIDRGTLAHELVHAQQDQYHDLTNITARPDVQDEQLAVQGLYEGEANYLEARYHERCEADWECVPSAGAGGGSGADLNLGVYFTLFHPYSDGPPYVRSLVENGGWEAVDVAFASPPNSTEQVIHHTDEEPVPLAVSDEARAGWNRFPEQGLNGTDRAGEASMFSMMWYQADQFDADTVPRNTVVDTDGPYDVYNYGSTPTAGWANDAIVPYRKGTFDGPRYGYVWVTEWDTVTDAGEFREAYLAILDAHDARRLGPQTRVIDAGPFADAFRIEQSGTRVTIVNAPEAADLEDIRPSMPGVSPPPTTTAPATPATPTTSVTEQPMSPMDPEDTPSDDGGVTAAPAQLGFGVVAAVSGILGAWALWRRRRP